MNTNENRTKEKFFRTTVYECIGITIFLEFVVELYSFPIWVELFLVPFASVILLLSTIASMEKYRETYKPIKKPLETVLVIIGFVILWHSFHEAYVDAKHFWSLQTLKDFLFYPLMTIGFLPCIYFFTLYSTYDMVFGHIGTINNPDSALIRKAEWRIFWYGLINMWKLKTLWRRNSYKILNVKTEADLAKLTVFDDQSTPENIS